MSLVARLCAVWLVALITAPWSAPFPVCDVATFFERAPQTTSFAHTPLQPAAGVDDASVQAVPVVRPAPRVHVMDAVDHQSPWLTLSVSARPIPVLVPVPLINSPLDSPLRI